MVKKYKMGFDVWALVLFIAIMIPNIIWFAIPAPNDILRTESITKKQTGIRQRRKKATKAFVEKKRNE